MEPNPYEPPKEPDPLTAAKVVKRGVGLATIILLTPIALGIALCGSCAATYVLVSIPVVREWSVLPAILLVLYVVPPVMVLAAMIRWAVRTLRNNKAGR